MTAPTHTTGAVSVNGGHEIGKIGGYFVLHQMSAQQANATIDVVANSAG